jgi:hypothetical protein
MLGTWNSSGIQSFCLYQRQGKKRGRHVEKSALNPPGLESEAFCLTLRPPDSQSVTLDLKNILKESNY